MTILVDTREQRPLFNPSNGKASKNFFAKKLDVGDYSTVELLNRFHIERKSPGDLYGTLLKGHSRFRREIFRAHDRNITLSVYVECGEKKFYAKKWPGGNFCKFPGETIEKCINTMRKKYRLEFNFCSSRFACKKAIYKRLLYEERLHRLSNSNRKVGKRVCKYKGERKVNQGAPRY